jgi:hypothetical protein
VIHLLFECRICVCYVCVCVCMYDLQYAMCVCLIFAHDLFSACMISRMYNFVRVYQLNIQSHEHGGFEQVIHACMHASPFAMPQLIFVHVLCSTYMILVKV